MTKPLDEDYKDREPSVIELYVSRPFQFLIEEPIYSALYLASTIVAGNFVMLGVMIALGRFGQPTPKLFWRIMTISSVAVWWIFLPYFGNIWKAFGCLTQGDLACAKKAFLAGTETLDAIEDKYGGHENSAECWGKDNLCGKGWPEKLQYCAKRQSKGDLGDGSTRKACDKAFVRAPWDKWRKQKNPAQYYEMLEYKRVYESGPTTWCPLL
jgi:hypothetical protein